MYQNNIEIILTGSSGFLGSQILQNIYNYKINIFKIRTEDSINEIKLFLKKNNSREFILINAGWKDVKEYNPNKDTIEVNFRIQTKLLELLIFDNIKKFINLGTYNEYGLLTGVLKEDILNLRPISEYAKLKYKIFELCLHKYLLEYYYY